MHEIADSVQPDDAEQPGDEQGNAIFNSMSPPERSQLRENMRQLRNEGRRRDARQFSLPAGWERGRRARRDSHDPLRRAPAAP